jgi:hypothetical protein
VAGPAALWRGIVICSEAGGIPSWLAAGLITLLKTKRAQRRLWEPYQRRLVDFARFAAVRDARARGFTLEGAYADAQASLARTPAFGGTETMKKSYRLVARTDAARLGQYALRPPRV